MLRITLLFLSIVALPLVLHAQSTEDNDSGSVAKSHEISTGMQGEEFDKSSLQYPNAWGMDILISTGGFGLGGFYRREYSRDLSGFVTLSISEAKDDREVEYVDPLGGTYVPGKKNRFLVIPLMVGVQHRLFSSEIRDNFRPYLSAAVGPTLIYATPYKEEFFSALGKGHPYYTVGGYVGIGAFFGSDSAVLFGLNIRYYFVPYSSGIESLDTGPLKKDFGGFFITLNVGSAW